MDKIEAENRGFGIHSRSAPSVEYTEFTYKSSMLAMIEGAIFAVGGGFHLPPATGALSGYLGHSHPLSAIPDLLVSWICSGFNLNFLSLLALGLVCRCPCR